MNVEYIYIFFCLPYFLVDALKMWAFVGLRKEKYRKIRKKKQVDQITPPVFFEMNVVFYLGFVLRPAFPIRISNKFLNAIGREK